MRQKIGRMCMVLGALLILAAAALLAYNKWDASRADKASQEVLGELEQTLNAAIEEKANRIPWRCSRSWTPRRK